MEMIKQEFSKLLSEDEEILFIEGINKKAFIKTKLRMIFFIGLIPNLLPFMILAFTFFLPLTLSILQKMADKTYICITNKHVFKRSGVKGVDFDRIILNVVGELILDSNTFDSKEPDPSSSLTIISKSYSSGTTRKIITVPNLKKPYEAYKILSELTQFEGEKIKVV